MILAAGLSPAWQHILRFDALRVGQVNRARETFWCASGKVLNVAVALGHLGASCETVTLLGGAPRELIEREFAALAVPGHWVETQQPTRVCTTILDAATGETTELVENAEPVSAAELDEFVKVYEGQAARADVVILTGSLPAGAPSRLYRDLLSATACPAILDFRGDELLQALATRPLVVKPNREELATTLGRTLDTPAELTAAMHELNDRGAEWVVVTQGRGPVLATSAGRCYRLIPPTVDVVNPIGSGDCLAAGIAWGLTAGRAPLGALRLGVAAAVENVKQLLPGRLDPKRVLALAESIQIEEGGETIDDER